MPEEVVEEKKDAKKQRKKEEQRAQARARQPRPGDDEAQPREATLEPTPAAQKA